ncbi:uncharacterized protein LOC123703670 [Colias croceus]|uniref:uncharacterized protein LOC123703670 n=1 Tax=Colias crocea TaxID=72248 RepID=UPI001E27C473|nr:uncharacterized protein LOC123703670 [Colias croceus]
MDLLKLLLCVMLLLLCQICAGEKFFRYDSRYDRRSKFIKKPHLRSTRSTTHSHIIEEIDKSKEDIEPITIATVKPKTIPANVDKTKININLTPTSKAENNLKNKKNPNKTLATISRKPEKVILSKLIDKEKAKTKPEFIPIDLFLPNPVKDVKSGVEIANKKVIDEEIEKVPKIEHEINNDKLNIEPTIQKTSEIKPNTAKSDRKKPSSKKSQIKPKDKITDTIIEDEVIEDDLDKSLGDQCVDKILNLFPKTNKLSVESKDTHQLKATTTKKLTQKIIKMEDRMKEL